MRGLQAFQHRHDILESEMALPHLLPLRMRSSGLIFSTSLTACSSVLPRDAILKLIALLKSASWSSATACDALIALLRSSSPPDGAVDAARVGEG